jgi:uncharacterized repeat protein (TIGR01451 family)
MKRVALTLLFSLLSCVCWSQQTDFAAGDEDLKIVGGSGGDGLGATGAFAAGDLNGDGFADIVVGAPYANGFGEAREEAGAAYIIFSSGTPTGVIDPSGANGLIPDVVIYGASAGDHLTLGTGLLVLDVNGDMIDDLVLTAQDADGPGDARPEAGEAYVIYGSAALPAIINLGVGAADSVIYGATAGDVLGRDGALLVHDFNADSAPDLLIGSYLGDGPGNSRNAAGELYVIFGGAALPAIIDFDAGGQDVVIFGAEQSDSLTRDGALTVGDLNNDGSQDLIIGAEHADGPEDRRHQGGEAYVIFGGPAPPAVLDIAAGDYDVIILGASAGDNLTDGGTVLVGDINGDTMDDLVLGASFADGPAATRGDAGEVYVIYGGNGISPVIDLDLNQYDIVIFGADASDRLSGDGALVLGDFDGDGTDDIAIGAMFADGPGEARLESGEAYIFLGDSGLPKVLDLATNDQDVIIFGASTADFLTRDHALAAGDFDGDGRDDLVLAAYGADGPAGLRPESGEGYIIGGLQFLPSIIDFSRHEQDVLIYAATENDQLGFGPGIFIVDINDDLKSDLIIVSPLADGLGDGREDSGEVLVLLGDDFPPILAISHVTPPQTATIGDVLTYTLQINVKDGQISNVSVTDNLPSGLEFIPGTLAVGTGNIGMTTGFVDEATNAISINRLLAVALSLSNPADGDFTNDFFTVSFDVLVKNAAENQNTNLKFNTVAASNQVVAGTSIAELTIVEPELELVSEILSPLPALDLDAGDAIRYRLTLRHAGTSLTNAYDADLATALDLGSGQLIFSSLDSVTPVGGATETVTTTAIGSDLAGRFDLPLGSSVVVEFTATIQNSVVPGRSIDAVSTVTWTSQAGVDNNERTGSGLAANDYIATPPASTIGISDRPRVIHTQAPADLTIGEIARVQLRIDLIEGTTSNTMLTNTLPAGIAFLPSSLRVNLFGPQMTSGFVDEATSLSVIGPVMTVDLGTVLNPSDNNSANDFILVEFDVQVLNDPVNQNEDAKTNSALITDGVLSFQNDFAITILEPELTIVKQIISPDPAADVDAGDTVTYEVTIAHDIGSTSAAFDVAFSDLVDGGIGQFLVTDIVSTTLTGGTSVLNPAAIIDAGRRVAADFDIPLGGSVVLVFDAAVDSTVNPDQVLRNDATIVWTSLKGAPPQSRNGSDGVGGALNDYNAVSSPEINVESLLTVVHNQSPSSLRIGELGHFELEVTVIEGTTAGLNIVNTFPDMNLVPGSLVVNLAGNMSSGFVNEAGSSFSNGNLLAINFGNLVNLPDGNPSNDSFTVSFDATLANIAGNQNGDINTNQVSVNDGNLSDTATADFTILEPELTIDNSLVPFPGADMDAGDVLNFFVTIAHGNGSTAEAHDVVFNELIDGGSGHILITNILNTIVIGGSTVSIPTAIANGGTGISGTYEIPLGGSMEVSFQGVIQETVQRTQPIASDAEVRWTSLAGTPAGERTGAGAVNDYFATESEPTAVSSQLEVAHTDVPSTVVVGDVIRIETQISVIEGVTTGVMLADTLPTGLSFVPGSLSVVHNAPGMLSGFASEVAQLSTVPGGFTIDFGTITNPSDNVAANDTITIAFNLIADNIASNQNTANLTNALVVTTDSTRTGSDNATITIDEPELDVAVAITSTPSTDVDSADVITYKVTLDHGVGSTADAFDVDFTGLVDNGSGHLIADSITSIDATGGASISIPVTISGNGLTLAGEFDIPEGGSIVITYDAIVQSTVQPRQNLNTSASIRWSSLNGASGVERSGIGGLNDYSSTGLRATVVADHPTVLHVNPPTSASVGETFAYELEITLIEGSTPQLTLVNTLPTAHDLVPGSVSVTLNAPGMTADYVDEATSTSRVDQDVTFNLGNVFNPADNIAANDTITITFDVVSLNQNLNQNGNLKTNIASAFTQGILADVDEFENLVVVEPQLSLVNEKTSPAAILNQNIGDSIDYRIFIDHHGNSTADAFEASLVDTLSNNDGTLLITNIDSTLVSGGATILSAPSGLNSGVLSGLFNIPRGGSVEITFTATVQAGLLPAQDLDADAVLTWTSISGTSNPQERDGSGGLNDYRVDTTASSTAAQPEIVVIGNGSSITDGQSVTSASDFTDFGEIRKGNAGPSHSFFVRNDGDGPLTFGAISVPAGFTLTFGLPASIAPGGNATFTLQLDSSFEGTASGDIVIPNNDVNEAPFTFAITGHVKTPDVTVEGNGNNIANSDGTVDSANGTDFGVVRLGDPQVIRSFLVRNDGDDVLNVGSVNLPAGFTLIDPLASPLVAGASDSFSVQLGTSSLGTFDDNVTFTTDDLDENPFVFRIRGIVSLPEITVVGGAFDVSIANNSTPASTANGTDLGFGVEGSPGPRSVLTVRNDGATPLSISSLSIPSSFTLIDSLESTIPGNSSDTFTIELPTLTAGIVTGNIIIVNDDSDESTFTFQVRGDVQPAPPVSLSLAGSPFGENRGVATITASMATTSQLPVTVNLAFGGTASAGDYSLTTSEIIIPAGQLSGTTTLVGIRDGVPEADESISIDISSVINGQENGTQQVFAFILDQASTAQTLFVNAGATGNGTGTSWTDAFTSLATALSTAQPGDEIWVAGGTYTPGTDRTSSFTIANGTTILGGFVGNEPLASLRNPSTNVTTLSGEIGAPGSADNCYHVAWAADLGTASTLDGFVITGGNADGGGLHDVGAGIYASNSNLTIASSTIANNDAQTNGAGLWQGGGNLNIDTTTWQNNNAGNCGGAIHHFSGTLNIANSAFSGNSASTGGSFCNAGDGATITNSSFANDSATDGGNIAVTGSGIGTVAFVGGSYGNTSVPGNGGSVHVANGNVSFASGSFTNAQATNGGAIHVAGGDLDLIDTSITNSSATVWGGALNVVGGTATVTGGTFTGNSSATGGAFYVSAASLNVTGATFGSNNASNGADFASGGSGGNSVITASRFPGSQASNNGGAIYISGGTHQIIDSLLNANTATNGSAIYLAGGFNIITNSTIVANSGSALYLGNGTSSVNNSIIWGNGSNIQIDSGTLNVSYSAIQGSGGSGSWSGAFGSNGGGNIDVDPGFANFAGGDYRLAAVSPGVDSANSNLVSTTVDLDGNPRRADDLNTTDTGLGGLPPVDMGAFETPPSPLATIGDYVWLDENGDGSQQANESGVQGITVNLLSSTGSFIKSTGSDSVGFYQFGDLLGGSFIVEVEPDGRSIAPQNNTADHLDSDVDPSTFRSGIVTIVASEQQGNVDIGLGTGLVDVFWVFPENVAIDANNLTKNNSVSDLWQAGAISSAAIDNNGFVQTTVGETNTLRAIGLGDRDHVSNFSSIEYAVVLHNAGQFQVFENGSGRGTFGTYSPGDVIRIQVSGDVVSYWNNLELRYTSSTPVPDSKRPLYVDTSFNTLGATLKDVRIGAQRPVVNDFRAADIDGDNPAYSNGDTFTISFNLDTNQPGAGILDKATVDQLFSFSHNLGADYQGQWINPRTFEVTVTNIAGNGGVSIGATIATPVGGIPIADASGGSPRANNASPLLAGSFAALVPESVPVQWVSFDPDVQITGNSLQKLDTGGWDADAISNTSIEAGAAMVEMTVDEIDTQRAFGLTQDNPGRHYNTIDFAFLLRNDKLLFMYENGVRVGPFLPYFTGDVLRIEIVGSSIVYRRNGFTLFTSSKTITAANYPLIVDTSLHTQNSTINNVRMTPVAPRITRFYVGDPDASSGGLDNGDTLSILFDNDSNQPGGAGIQNKAAVDALFNFSQNLGSTYSGSWTAPDEFTIVLNSVAGSNLSLGSTVTPSQLPPISASAGSTPSSLQSPGLDGDFGEPLPIGVPVVWTNPVNVDVRGSTLIQLAAGGAGAIGQAQFPFGDAWVESEVVETTKRRTFGFGDGLDNGQSLADIKFGLIMTSAGLSVIENGSSAAGLGGYNTGDRLRVQVTGNQVHYLVNGAIRHTSTKTVTAGDFPMRVESSLEDFASTLFEVRRSGINGARGTNSLAAANSATSETVIDSVAIVLTPGWNLISLPVTPLVAAPQDVFTLPQQSIVIGEVLGFHDGEYVAVEELAANEGYWVYLPGDSPRSFAITGTVASSVDIAPGWNLIGVSAPAAVPDTINRATVQSFADGIYSGLNDNDAFPLKPTVGYWIHADFPHTISW